jgi:hypothetical protein
LVEAQDPHGLVPTSTPYIYKYKVFETIHSMLWMGRWFTIMPLSPYIYAQNLGVVVSILAVAIVLVTLILPLDLIVKTVVVIVFGFIYRAHVLPTP